MLPYSIDEQFLDMTGCEKLFGPPWQMADRINKAILGETGIRCRIGIGENLLQAKMACDCFAKKTPQGIFQLNTANYAHYTWPLPIKKLFGISARLEIIFRTAHGYQKIKGIVEKANTATGEITLETAAQQIKLSAKDISAMREV